MKKTLKPVDLVIPMLFVISSIFMVVALYIGYRHAGYYSDASIICALISLVIDISISFLRTFINKE